MGLFDFLKKKNKPLPFVARVNIADQQKEKSQHNNEDNKLLASYIYAAQGQSTKFCLRYVALEGVTHLDSTGTTLKLGKTYFQTETFVAPDGMDFEDACKVISYLSDKLEHEQDLAAATPQSLKAIQKILPSYGFKRVYPWTQHFTNWVSDYNRWPNIDDFEREDQHNIVPLYAIGGDINFFKRSNLNREYFEWFTPNVSLEDVLNIYAEANIPLQNNVRQAERI